MVNTYLQRLYDTITSRGYVEVEQLAIDIWSNKRGAISGQLIFHDGSSMDFGEVIILRERQIVKLRYTYHYQDASGEMVFRYDNAPHHPSISTHPHHKHVGSTVESSQPPDISMVLREIDKFVFMSD